jgi:hypothetical protein
MAAIAADHTHHGRILIITLHPSPLLRLAAAATAALPDPHPLPILALRAQ